VIVFSPSQAGWVIQSWFTSCAAHATGPDGRVFGSDKNKTATNAAGYVASVGDGAEPDQLRDNGIPAGRWGRVQDIALAAV
jgi:hypothetical protein